MPAPNMPSPPTEPKPLHVTGRVQVSDHLHPGWVRATAILLKGLARLNVDKQKPAS